MTFMTLFKQTDFIKCMNISLEKYLTQVGIFPQNGESVFQKQQLTAALRPPRSLGWGGGRGKLRTEAVRVNLCLTRVVRQKQPRGRARILQLKMSFKKQTHHCVILGTEKELRGLNDITITRRLLSHLFIYVNEVSQKLPLHV